MPGAIQVSVVEFKSIESSSDPSSATSSLKVSMGTRYHQTWDKGDFSFPVTKLKEDLAVTLLDAGGIEIAYTGIKTMLIIQKGSWDEIFSLEGGGYVHLKLRFVLSDEERNRIRVMRESAMKKKQETSPNINLRLSESTTYTRDNKETPTQIEQKVEDSRKRFETEIVTPEAESSQEETSSNSRVSYVSSVSQEETSSNSQEENEIPRESATEKKQETSPNINLRLSESASVTREYEEKSTQIDQKVDSQKSSETEIVTREVDASQEETSSNSHSSYPSSVSSYKKDEDILQENEIPRESAMKKKQETSPNINLKLSKSTSVARKYEEASTQIDQEVDSRTKFQTEILTREVEASQEETSSNSHASYASLVSSYQKDEEIVQGNEIPNAADPSQDPPSPPVKYVIEEKVPTKKIEIDLPLFNTSSVLKEGRLYKFEVPRLKLSEEKKSSTGNSQDDPIFKSESRGPMEKTPSNVRKMISAFENSKLQDKKPLRMTPPVQSQLTKVEKKRPLEDHDKKVVCPPADQNPARVGRQEDFLSSKIEPSQSPKELEPIVSHLTSSEKDSNIEDNIASIEKDSTIEDDIISVSSNEPIAKEQENLPDVDLTRQSTSETATSSGRVHEEQSREIQDNDFPPDHLNISESSVAGVFYDEEHYSYESSGIWIFPDKTRHLCVTTSGTDGENKIFSGSEILEENVTLGTEYKTETNEKDIDNQPESGFGDPPDIHYNGLIRQMINVAVIFSFGVLVLLTK